VGARVVATVSYHACTRRAAELCAACTNQLALLMSLLELRGQARLHAACLRVLQAVLGDASCARALPAPLSRPLLLLLSAGDAQLVETSLAVLAILARQPVHCAAMLDNGMDGRIGSADWPNGALLFGGACIHLLHCMCNEEQMSLRLQAAETLAKLCADKLNGPRWTRLLARFLPDAFVDLVQTQPAACLQLFEGVVSGLLRRFCAGSSWLRSQPTRRTPSWCGRRRLGAA